jgi:acyl carrier protein
MASNKTIEQRVRDKLASFLADSGNSDVELCSSTNLIDGIGLTSREGMEFVLDLCDEFEFEFPTDFNPFVDDQLCRGQTLDGLIKAVEGHLSRNGASHGKK